MSEDHGAEPPPEACKATGRESSSQARSQVQQAIQKFAKGITKKISTRSKRPHSLIPAGLNVDLQDTPSNQNVEDVSHPHPSANKHPASSENPSGCINQGSPREPISKAVSIPSGVDETSGPESVGTELQGAHEASEHMKTLGGRAQSVASIANNTLADLAAADNFQTNYLQPLKIFDTAIEKIANVWAFLLSW
ncbi:uncharacterized protein F5891DRAFT_986085 [Suillus fuscotomentosus]|uniref:Uncharacterized protein n=1 Tax=Suillus fuscotomentosus TaxID=1912939 RepID=A0AAD4DUQ1_9AGAM|nr:uncharacterized protein F5891DRAFT_986085 [Suillus fuscotomentosus]KAG1893238.1 hypothetical protein F5891DRAFT_986085 [Suillus fuscotomentosus]